MRSLWHARLLKYAGKQDGSLYVLTDPQLSGLHADAGLGTLHDAALLEDAAQGMAAQSIVSAVCLNRGCPARQVDQAVVEVAARVRLHSNRSQAGEWARVSDDSEVRGISEERVREVSFDEAAARPHLQDACQSPGC